MEHKIAEVIFHDTEIKALFEAYEVTVNTKAQFALRRYYVKLKAEQSLTLLVLQIGKS